jgi:EF hand
VRNKALYLTSALSVALVLVSSAGAQPPDRGRPGRRGGPAAGFGAGGGIERVLDDMKLSEKKKEQADAAVKEYRENIGKLMGLARSDLLLKMKELLSEQEFKKFNETLDRAPALANVRGRRGDGFFGNRGLTVDQIVERIMSFDKNGDGKITKEELPERMQDLIARGDTNKDGALDKEEVQKLAADLARNRFRGFNGRGGFGAGFGPRGRSGPGGVFPGAIERAVEDLNLPSNKKETAETAVKAHQDNTRKLMELARADLLMKMTQILSDDEFKTFKVALERRPGFGPGFGFAGPARPAGTSGSGDLERRLDQLQRDLDNLRREIRR